VSADSQQVYKHFDIGTAKPPAQELAVVPHHLISVVEPTEKFSAARFQKLADEAIAQIRARGKQVVVVGGTGLYIRTLLHGLIEAAEADPELRGELEALSDDALHARLAAVDAPTAARLPKRDRLRVIRAVEIHAQTGRPASESRRDHAFEPDRYEYKLWVLEPEREQLYVAINARTKAMFDRGLVDEVRRLVAQGYRDAPPMGSVGYAQALEVVEGTLTPERAIALAAQATRHYAKRQRTWFRKEKGAQFIKPPHELRTALLEMVLSEGSSADTDGKGNGNGKV
jgi:tRNA dimethylallyltransferase